MKNKKQIPTEKKNLLKHLAALRADVDALASVLLVSFRKFGIAADAKLYVLDGMDLKQLEIVIKHLQLVYKSEAMKKRLTI